MLGSNQRPLPCEGSESVCWGFLELAICLQTAEFLRRHISEHFRSFTRVAARLLHIQCSGEPNGPAGTAVVASLAEECGPVPPRTQAIQETGPDQVLQRGPPNRRPAVKIGDARERSFVPLAEDCG